MYSEAFERLTSKFWRYYRELEREFLATRKYVEIEKGNFKTYSLEYLKLFEAVCSEIDVVGKAMAKHVNPEFDYKHSSIKKWWYEIQNQYTVREYYTAETKGEEELKNISLREYSCGEVDGLRLQPWKDYHYEITTSKEGKTGFKLSDGCTSPTWWVDYNNVKHERITWAEKDKTSNYEKANLMNVLMAFSALYILEQAFMNTVGTESDNARFNDFSELFSRGRYLTFGQIPYYDKHI